MDDQHGGSVAIDFEPIIAHIEAKRVADAQRLSELVNGGDPRAFQEQQRLLAEYQAGMRAIDVLRGVIDVDGEQRYHVEQSIRRRAALPHVSSYRMEETEQQDNNEQDQEQQRVAANA